MVEHQLVIPELEFIFLTNSQKHGSLSIKILRKGDFRMLSRVKNIGAEVIHLADDKGVSRPFRILFAGFIQEHNQLVLRELFKRCRLIHFCFLLIIIEEYHA